MRPDIECVTGAKKCNGSCKFCRWLAASGSIATVQHRVHLGETKRLVLVGQDASKEKKAKSNMLMPAGTLVRFSSATLSSYPEHIVKVAAFQRLISHLGTAPWASSNFHINDRMIRRLIISHLPLIVGKEAARTHREQLAHLIDPEEALSTAQNLVWITNRQQGKTSTLGKFIAALAIASPVGGLVATIYSTSLDRAVELAKAAKAYIHWLRTAGKSDEFSTGLKMYRENERSFVVETPDGARNEIAARPRNVDSCRGDAPPAAFFDEVGFISEAFWYQFAYPLLQVKGRVFTCTTTPPPANGFFEKFVNIVKEKNAEGDFFFALVNHSLSCESCLAAREEHRCVHNLNLVPPWKSILRVQHMSKLLSKGQQEDFAKEVFGVLPEGKTGYFDKRLLQAAWDRPRVERLGPFVSNIVYIAVDPASHSKSNMGFCAIALQESGTTVLLGGASVNAERCEALQIQALSRDFCKNLDAMLRERMTEKKPPIFVPIIECNGSEIMARSILSAIKSFRSGVAIPFTSRNFAKDIKDGVGVWTTDEVKEAAVQEVLALLVEGRLVISEKMATTSRKCFDPLHAKYKKDEDPLETLQDELLRIADDEKGRITGKTSKGENDDLAISFLLAAYWSAAVRFSCPTPAR